MLLLPASFTECTHRNKWENIDPFPTDSLFNDLDRGIIEQKARIIDSAFTRLNRRYGFNGCVLYAEKGRLVYENAFGYADFRKKEPLTLQSQFQLASVSKMFTAMAIMILHEQGKLDYDDPLVTFIPEFPDKEITIRMLLNHRSGLTNYNYLADEYWDRDLPMSNEDVIELFAKYDPPPYFSPNNGFHYCNTNYALLASVVERITGESFDQYARENIFEPLGMDHTFIYNLRGDTLVPRYVPVGVQGHLARRRRPYIERDYYQNGVMGDKGVYSTIQDLYNWDQALYKEKLVTNGTLQEAFSPGSPRYRGRINNYGFGWRIKDGRDSTVFHYGWWKGFRSYFIRDMAQQKTIIVLTNIDRAISSSHLWKLIDDHHYELGAVEDWPKRKPHTRKRKRGS